MSGCQWSGPISEFVINGGLDVREVEGEAVTKTNFFPKAGKGGSKSTKNLGVCAGFLGELGEIFDLEFLLNGAVLVEEFEFHEVFGAVEIEEGLGIGRVEFVAVEGGKETSGAAAVLGDDFVEAGGGGGGVERAEGFGVLVERV